MAENMAYTSRRGAAFIQKTGANSQPQVLRCLDADEISSPKGGVELIKCWNAFGNGWIEMGKTLSAPDASTISLTQLTEKTLSALEKIYCPVTILLAQTSQGKVTEINNAERVIIMKNAVITDEGYSDVVHHIDDNETMHSVSFSGDSDITVVGYPTIIRITTTETMALNDIHGNIQADCDDRLEPGDKLIAVADADADATANVLYSEDGGSSWTAAATQPFAADEHIAACQWFMKDLTTERWIVAMEAPAAEQGMIGYSDDQGATWSTVNVGGAAAGHGATLGGGLFVDEIGNIWLASAAGYIYKSEDGGESWTAKESGSIDTEDYNHIHFFDSDNGVAVANNDVIIVTTDGGETWSVATATGGGGNLLSCWMPEEDTIWVGDDAGDVYYSHDDGDTWAERTGLSGAPTAINDIEFFDSQVAFLASDNVTPVGAISQTVTGGYSWRAFTTPTNSGINALFVVTPNLAFMVGEANGGTAFIGKLSA
jgi:photosystem II stability/assembly factor-like uncharacterized protein